MDNPSKPWVGASDETPIFDALMKEHVDCHAECPLTVFQNHMIDQELEIRDLKVMLENPSRYGEAK